MFAGVETSYACSCPQPGSPEEELARWDVVLQGTVLSARNISRLRVVDYLISVTRVWKGTVRAGENVTIRSPNQSSLCGVQLDVGESYLVYAEVIHGSQLQTVICSRTAKAALRSSYIAALNGIVDSQMGAPHASDSDVDRPKVSPTGHPTVGSSPPCGGKTPTRCSTQGEPAVAEGTAGDAMTEASHLDVTSAPTPNTSSTPPKTSKSSRGCHSGAGTLDEPGPLYLLSAAMLLALWGRRRRMSGFLGGDT